MIKVIYSELDGPQGATCRLEAAGHAGYAPAGQDIVCAGASTLMQALVYLLAGTEGTASLATDRPDGPCVTVTAVPDAFRQPCVEGAFELAKAGFALLAERYPDYLSYSDTSEKGEQAMMDLQLFAEGAEGAEAAPALSRAQEQQAIASGTMKPSEARREAEVRDIRLEVPYTDYASRYLMGLGHLGLGNEAKAKQHFDIAAEMDNNHQGVQIHRNMIDNAQEL